MSAAIDMPSLYDPEDDFPTRRLTLMSNSEDRDTSPASAEPSSLEAPTRTENERPMHPALAPPKLPTDLESSALASKEPPQWFKESFIGTALTKFATDAEDIRKGRNEQHREQMAALAELRADNDLIRGEVQALARSSQAADAEHNKRFAILEKEIKELKAKLAAQERDLKATYEAIEAVEKKLREDAEARAAAASAAKT